MLTWDERGAQTFLQKRNILVAFSQGPRYYATIELLKEANDGTSRFHNGI
jgi:hypothetical protein